MCVYLGGDHGGYELKQAIAEHLSESGHEPIDCGAAAMCVDVLEGPPSCLRRPASGGRAQNGGASSPNGGSSTGRCSQP
ncbi:hypothetical protein ACVWWN_000727 [Mycobacterium sp. URHB0021]